MVPRQPVVTGGLAAPQSHTLLHPPLPLNYKRKWRAREVGRTRASHGEQPRTHPLDGKYQAVPRRRAGGSRWAHLAPRS